MDQTTHDLPEGSLQLAKTNLGLLKEAVESSTMPNIETPLFHDLPVIFDTFKLLQLQVIEAIKTDLDSSKPTLSIVQYLSGNRTLGSTLTNFKGFDEEPKQLDRSNYLLEEVLKIFKKHANQEGVYAAMMNLIKERKLEEKISFSEDTDFRELIASVEVKFTEGKDNFIKKFHTILRKTNPDFTDLQISHAAQLLINAFFHPSQKVVAAFTGDTFDDVFVNIVNKITLGLFEISIDSSFDNT